MRCLKNKMSTTKTSERRVEHMAEAGIIKSDKKIKSVPNNSIQKEENKTVEKFEKAKRKNKLVRKIRKVGNWLLDHGFATWAILILIWQIISLFYDDTFLPGPVSTLKGGLEIILDGKLLLFSLISLKRVLIGWVIGTLVAAPLGLLVGRVIILRRLVEPFINFFRFIPALALLTLFLMWFDVGELSKEVLIIYAVVFTVMVNTIAGVMAVSDDRINSARTLGATEWQIISTVIWPSIIPYIFTGARLGLGGAFSSIIAAEMLAAKEGLGYLIYTSRLYFHTDWIFIGTITLGLIGFLSDKILRVLGNRFLGKYGVQEKSGIQR